MAEIKAAGPELFLNTRQQKCKFGNLGYQGLELMIPLDGNCKEPSSTAQDVWLSCSGRPSLFVFLSDIVRSLVPWLVERYNETY